MLMHTNYDLRILHKPFKMSNNFQYIVNDLVKTFIMIDITQHGTLR